MGGEFPTLVWLDLSNSPELSNVQPLLYSVSLRLGLMILLASTNVSCEDVAALGAKSVTVVSDC